MGNCLLLSSPSKALPIDTIFKLPSPLPAWPTGGGFGSGTIDLGGLEIRQISSFTKVWSTYEGGPGNLGATFFEPSAVPDGFSVLGYYCQPNNRPLSGWVLVGKDVTNVSDSSSQTLKSPIDHTLVWSSEGLKLKKQGGTNGYIWQPIPPAGYKAVGHVVTTSPEKPPLDKIRCVRTDLTDDCRADNWIWGEGTASNSDGFGIYSLKPTNTGTKSLGVTTGTFVTQNSETNSTPLACLKNNKFDSFSSMPNLSQIEAIIQSYSPLIYFHPKETYLPSSVNWYFTNGALLYTKSGDGSTHVPVDPTGSNLPQGGSNDGQFWLDLPIDENAKERVKKGDLQSSEAYIHVKPMFGATFTDLATWVFYPFNGPGTGRLLGVDVPLGRIGEHVGDWEHLTLRVSNFNGELKSVYFSQHSKGSWIDASSLEYFGNSNKAVAYSSLSGHANYPSPGLVMQGTTSIGIKNETSKGKLVMDTGEKFSIVSAEYVRPEIVAEPPWVNYLRKWGPNITYQLRAELEKVENLLVGNLKPSFQTLVKNLPNEVLGEDGPTGPKSKNSWNGDEP